MSNPAPGTLPIGERLGNRYELEEPLCASGTLCLVRACDTQLDREVLIEAFVDLAAPVERRTRFWQESRALTRSHGVEVPSVLDMIGDPAAAGEPLFRVLTSTTFPTLRHHLDGLPRLEAARRESAGALARALLAPLEKLHAARLPHLNLTPDTVRVSDNGHVLLYGFGASLFHRDPAAWVAPELLDGQSASASSDLYSLAAILLEALAGPESSTPDVALARLPIPWRRVLEAALEPDPALRLASPRAWRALFDALSRADASRMLRQSTHGSVPPSAPPPPDPPGSKGDQPARADTSVAQGARSASEGPGSTQADRPISTGPKATDAKGPTPPPSEQPTTPPAASKTAEGAVPEKEGPPAPRAPAISDCALIPAGTFTMGSPEPRRFWRSGGGELGRSNDEHPHEVRITRAFWMLKAPVTQGQWVALMESPCPASFKKEVGAPDLKRPVESVTWFDAIQFCNKLSSRHGLEPAYTLSEGPEGGTVVRWTRGLDTPGWRLPTEAEWEWACRARTHTATWRGDLSRLDDHCPELAPIAWTQANSQKKTQEVATRDPNGFGLYDMLGNVHEWCWDRYGPYKGSAVDPIGPDDNTQPQRVLRGGAWQCAPAATRAATRHAFNPTKKGNDIGFRIVRLWRKGEAQS